MVVRSSALTGKIPIFELFSDELWIFLLFSFFKSVLNPTVSDASQNTLEDMLLLHIYFEIRVISVDIFMKLLFQSDLLKKDNVNQKYKQECCGKFESIFVFLQIFRNVYFSIISDI